MIVLHVLKLELDVCWHSCVVRNYVNKLDHFILPQVAEYRERLAA